MFIVNSRNGEVHRSQGLTAAMAWLVAKAAEYTRVSWLPGSGDEVIRLGLPSEEYVLVDTKAVYKWVVTTPVTPATPDGVAADVPLGIFDNVEDAKRSIEMTWVRRSTRPSATSPLTLTTVRARKHLV